MKAYYQDPTTTLYLGDCREVLTSIAKAPCTIITDPMWSAEGCAVLDEALRCCLAMRLAVVLGCDSDPFWLPDSGLAFFRLVFLELVRPHYKGRLMYTGDIAYLYGSPPSSKPGQRVIPGKCLDTSADGKQSEHPFPRKLAHMEWLVKWWTETGDLIIDPFVGSGTTALAAKKMNRLFIGIDTKAEYLDMTVKRLHKIPIPMELGV